MRPLDVPKNSFRSGEIDDLLSAREDIQAYQHGAKGLKNWRLLDGGGIARRPGMIWHDTIAGHGQLISFIFDADEEYVCVFTQGRVDIYLVYYVGVHVKTDLVQTITGQPWTEGGVHYMDNVQKLDTMFLASGDGSWPMKVMKRTSLYTFTITDYAFEENLAGDTLYQPYYKFADTGTKLNPSGTTGSINLTTSKAHWEAGHVGTYVRYKKCEIEITSITSSTIAVGTVRKTLPSSTADTDWDEQVFSALHGYQRSVAFHDSRLVIGGSGDLPNIAWLSKTSAYYNFDVGTGLDDEAFDRPIDSGVVERILWLQTENDLEIYTDYGMHAIQSNETKPLTPGTAPRRKQESAGCHTLIKPVSYDGATVYVQKNGKAVREVLWSDNTNKYQANKLSLLASHLLKSPIDMAAMNGDYKLKEDYCLIANDDGSMAVFHSIRDEKAAGWVPWETEGKVKSVCQVGDHTFMVVERPVAVNPFTSEFSDEFGPGTVEYHLEHLEADATLDMALTVEEPFPTTVFHGFDHLIGRTVSVVSNNAIYHGDYVVANDGSITIDEEAVSITAGLNYSPVLRTLRPKVDFLGRPIMGDIKRAISIVLQLNNVLSLVGNGHKLLVRRVTEDLSEDPTAISDDREIILQGYSRDAEVTITQEEPLPCTIKGFHMKIGVA